MRTTPRNAVTLTGDALGRPMIFGHGHGREETADAIQAWPEKRDR